MKNVTRLNWSQMPVIKKVQKIGIVDTRTHVQPGELEIDWKKTPVLA